MVAVVERGGFLWFCNFFCWFCGFCVFFVDFYVFLLHMAKVDGYMVRFSRFCIGLAFCPSVFELSSFDFVLRPFLRVPFP